MKAKGFVIHLERAKDREPLVEALINRMSLTADMKIWPGIEGGNYGCTASHLALYRQMLEEGVPEWYVFEDDCVMPKWFNRSMAKYDIYLIGATDYVKFHKLQEQEDVARVYKFYGTHAMIMTAKAAKAILEVAESEAPQIPMDHLVMKAIEKKDLIVYGTNPPRQDVHQKCGIVSYITGNIRQE